MKIFGPLILNSCLNCKNQLHFTGGPPASPPGTNVYPSGGQPGSPQGSNVYPAGDSSSNEYQGTQQQIYMIYIF